MPQVSKYKLDKEVEKEIFRQFWRSVSHLQTSEEVASFFTDLLTDTEEIMLAKRFAVAVLILRGKRPVEIAPTLHVSFSTVRSVASWVKNAKPQTRHVFSTFTKEQNWQALFDRIDKLLDELPPRYGTNWSAAGQAKWGRAKERLARQSLR